MFFKKSRKAAVISVLTAMSLCFCTGGLHTNLPYGSIAYANEQNVIVGGDAIGIKIYCDGIRVVSLSDITDTDGNICCPARNAGMLPGDIIKGINSVKVTDIAHFCSALNALDGQSASLELQRDEQTVLVNLKPAKTPDGYKIGAWVRDSGAGIGTLTFVLPDSGNFGALGHSINDADTKKPLSINDASVGNCLIIGINKSESANPGELRGVLGSDDWGVVFKNNDFGLYGRADLSHFSGRKRVAVADRNEIKTGAAQIISTLDDNTPAIYDIEVVKIYAADNDSKGILFKVTDTELLKKTGGIVQGMSGSPILQDGKLIGAVTHVLLNNPEMGYGIFIDLMINQAES